jgi:SSS family solute:Na+ symporter
MGLMLSAYFSAILSTADSCLMAASGNVVSDILGRIFHIDMDSKKHVYFSQAVTLAIGIVSLLLATIMSNVLELMLYSYAFMVSGLLIPVLGGLFWKRSTPAAAFWAMLVGGSTTVALTVASIRMPFGLDPNVFGLTASLLVFVVISMATPGTEESGLHSSGLQPVHSGK